MDMDKTGGGRGVTNDSKKKKKKKKGKRNRSSSKDAEHKSSPDVSPPPSSGGGGDGDKKKQTPLDTRPVDDARVAKVAKQVLAACSAAKTAIAQRNEAVRIWELVRERIRCTAWDTMLQRSKTGTPVEFIDRKQVREFKSFTRLRGFRYGGGGGSDTANGKTSGMPLWDRLSMEDDPRKEIAAVTGVLENHFSDLKRIYRHYSCAEPGSAGTMDLNEMWMLAKDTKLLDGPSLTLQSVQQLFLATSEALNNKPLTETASSTSGKGKAGRSRAGLSGGVVSSRAAAEIELMAPQFVEMLVRIADTKFSGISAAWTSGNDVRSPAPSGASEKLLTLSQCLTKLLDENIIPFACRSDADRFRRDLSRLEVKAVFRRHRDRLQSLFKHWCVAGEDHMDTGRWRSFARDRNFLSEAFTEAELFSVFNKIQDEEGALLASAGGLTLHADAKKKKSKAAKIEPTVDEKTAAGEEDGGGAAAGKKEADRQEAIAIGNLNDEMTFSEFSEGLAAIAVYKDPDPYLPLHQKIESFLLNSVFGKLSADKMGARGSSKAVPAESTGEASGEKDEGTAAN